MNLLFFSLCPAVCEVEVICCCASTRHSTGACQDSSRNPNRASPKHRDPEHPEDCTPTDSKNRLTMAQMFSISDNESETSEDREESGQTKNNSGSPQRKQHVAVPDRLKGEQLGRHRNLSMNEEDLLETGAADEGDLVGGDPFRRRSRSAPPALWAAKKYGQQLRRMSDEFDILLDKGMKRVKSAGTTRQMRQSPSWLAFLWSHKESDAESRPAE
uniref:Bcl2-associated agonist of cell death-like n=1 Tax=Cyprinus carpio TaxID=7962 RepID=A0A8C1K3R5_CYPCA